MKMYSQKYIFQIALKCERKTKIKNKTKIVSGPVFQARAAGTITTKGGKRVIGADPGRAGS
jgi:hypothetical protein